MAFTGRRQALENIANKDSEPQEDLAGPAKSPYTPRGARKSHLNHRSLRNRLSEAIHPQNKKFDAALRRRWLRLAKQTRLDIRKECHVQIHTRMVRGEDDQFALLRSLVMSHRALHAPSIDEEAPLADRLADVRVSPKTVEAQDELDAAPAPLDDDLLREIAFDDGGRPRHGRNTHADTGTPGCASILLVPSRRSRERLTRRDRLVISTTLLRLS
jgi:hypothetical protein